MKSFTPASHIVMVGTSFETRGGIGAPNDDLPHV